MDLMQPLPNAYLPPVPRLSMSWISKNTPYLQMPQIDEGIVLQVYSTTSYISYVIVVILMICLIPLEILVYIVS